METLRFYSKATAITPSANAIDETHAIYVGSAGDLVVEIGGSEVTFSSIPAGIYELRVTKVLEGTAAGGIVALYRGQSL